MIRPAWAAEPVTARTNSGNAVCEIGAPRCETACPTRRSAKLRLRCSGTGSAAYSPLWTVIATTAHGVQQPLSVDLAVTRGWERADETDHRRHQVVGELVRVDLVVLC